MDVNARAHEIGKALAEVERRVQNAAKKAGREPEGITLVVVTKTYPIPDIESLRQLGMRNFAENRDDDGAKKSRVISGTWHFQGQIQSNKIHSIAQWADVVHSLDDARHVSLLDQAIPEEKKMKVFIQVGLDESVGRGGVKSSGILALAELIMSSGHLRLEGLMAVAPLGENPESVFARLAVIHSDFCLQFPESAKLSAGMSNDFETAIAYGATHVRVGSSILGSRKGPL